MRPEQFIGIHCCSRVDKMMLVEIIMAEKTGDKALAVALDYVKAIKKTPIVVNDTRGFYVKRWFGVTQAPSQVVAIDPDDGTTEVLFDDPEGALISAATAAAVHDGWLLIGSAFGPGLVACRMPVEYPSIRR